MIWAEGTAETKAVEPYEAIACIYDRLMRSVDYPRWGDFIVQILRMENKLPSEVIELACGTGIIAHHLTTYDCRVTGYDRSLAMVEQARRKYDSSLLRFETGIFSDFPRDKKYDVAICLYDSINYIMDFAELVGFIGRVNQVLHPGGIFIFDICTRYNSFVNFRGYRDKGYINGMHYLRLSNYSPRTHIHTNDFMLRKPDDPGVHYVEHHRQVIYSVKQMKSAINQGGLTLKAMYDDIDLKPVHRRSFRIHFLTRKP